MSEVLQKSKGYSFYHNHGSGKCLYLKGNFYWRSIFHFHDYGRTCILLNFLDTVWIFQNLPTSDFFEKILTSEKLICPSIFRWLLLRSWVPPLMEMLYMEVGQAWCWRCIFNSHQLIGLLLYVRATIHYYLLLYSYWFVVLSPYLCDFLCYLYPSL